MELCSQGNLYSFLHPQVARTRGQSDNISEHSQVVKYQNQIAYGIASGMAFVHSLGITHGDLSSMNVLLTSKFVPKIGM